MVNADCSSNKSAGVKAQIQSNISLAVSAQFSARQPYILLILFMYVLPFWLLAAAFKAALHWTAFAEFAADRPKQYQLSFFICQATLICFLVTFSSIKFTTALWRPRATGGRIGLSLLILSPALGWYLYRAFTLSTWVFKVTTLQNPQLEQIHDYLWAGLPYGSNLNGVVLSSIAMTVGPVFEEVIFTGFLLNVIGKRWGIVTAILVVPFIFTLAHIPQQGFGIHLVPILISGFSFVCIRLVSGNLFYSIISHLLINTFFLLPGWIEAYVFFHS
jgi:membrane protease YdiL (CAAX protease family)